MTVIGLGYLGATSAIAFAKMGHQVLGIDPDQAKVRALQSGSIPFFEPGLDNALSEVKSNGKIRFASSHDDESRKANVHFLCVGTPQSKVGLSADTSYLFTAVDELLPYLAKDSVIAGKSTVPVGTADLLIEHIKNIKGFLPHLSWNPEFLQEGRALEDSLYPNRIVIGSSDRHSTWTLRQLYRNQIEEGIPVVETDLRTAELVKVAANAFLATKISFINLMAEVAEVAGADTAELAKAIGYDDRIGSKFLRNGIGYGGGCLPKDLRSFVARSRELGLQDSIGLLEQVEAINSRRRNRPVELAKEYFGSLVGKEVLILGASFKPDTDDIRDSPSLEVAELFVGEGAVVTVHDPMSLPKVSATYPTLRTQPHLETAFRNKEVVVLGTEWGQYKQLDPASVSISSRPGLIIDGRNALDVAAWKQAGWAFMALGNGFHQVEEKSQSSQAVA